MDNIESKIQDIEKEISELKHSIDEVIIENHALRRAKEKSNENVISDNNKWAEGLENEAVGILKSYEHLKTENSRLKQEIDEILEESGERVFKRILDCAKQEHLRTGNNPFNI